MLLKERYKIWKAVGNNDNNFLTSFSPTSRENRRRFLEYWRIAFEKKKYSDFTPVVISCEGNTKAPIRSPILFRKARLRSKRCTALINAVL